jgi:hypothetical protein
MGLSLTQAAPAAHRITAEDRVERIGQLTTRQLTGALLWLAGYAPDVFDVVADAVEPFAGDGSRTPHRSAPSAAATSACSSSSAWIGGITAAPTSPTWSCSSRGTAPSWPGARRGCPRSPRGLRSRRQEAAGRGASTPSTRLPAVSGRLGRTTSAGPASSLEPDSYHATRWPSEIGSTMLPNCPGVTA